MKSHISLIIAAFFMSLWSFGQQKLFSNLPKDSVVKLNPIIQQSEFIEGEILIKFSDEIPLQKQAKTGTIISGNETIDQLLDKYVDNAERLFPGAKKESEKKILKAPNGKDFIKPSLHNIYKLKLKAGSDMFGFIEACKNIPGIEFAEPNFIFSIVSDKPVSPVLCESEIKHSFLSYQLNGDDYSENRTIVPDDPFYNQQWHLPEVSADATWDLTTGDTSHVIAILDTGVDWLHPDLQNKIWINEGEILGNNIDDDNNGFVDDVRGWDWINPDNNPMDDNSHGTHVAGIAAAETDNGIGIAGVDWGARIMALKVFQSSGKGDIATICEGINYAAEKNATVINMSFGSYSYSGALENTLANAYSTSVLVAAAGNDGAWIGPCFYCYPMYPAAFSFVLGVQTLDSFSNFDQDGPVYSDYPDLFNYELFAPGTNILSTIPNGNYRIYQGTSMATPIVSGAITLYKSIHPDDSQELIWGNLIQTLSGNLDIYSAIMATPQPDLWFVNKTIVDTINNGDNDGLADAGETVEIWYTARNVWGSCDSVMLGLRFGEFEDTTVANILISDAFMGSASSYANITNEFNPLKVQIDPDVPNGRDIVFQAYLWYPGAIDTVYQDLILSVVNGTELSGVMDSTMVLDAGRLWIVNNSFKIYGTLIIEPGAKMKLYESFTNEGNVIGNGTADSVIIIEGPGIINGQGNMNFINTEFRNIDGSFGKLSDYSNLNFENCLFENINSYGQPDFWSLFRGFNISIKNCRFQYCTFSNIVAYGTGNFVFESNNLYKCYLQQYGNSMSYWKRLPSGKNNFVDIRDYSSISGMNPSYSPLFISSTSNSIHNNFISFGSEDYPVYAFKSIEGAIIDFPGQYWGTTDMEKIKEMNFDFWDDPNLAMYDYTPILNAPVDSAHAVVWKILVNGQDAQDEYVDPVGVGSQRFDVYFNREMDTTVTPLLTFGVTNPYTQQAVFDSASWSTDHKVWTAFKYIQLYTGGGINRLRVSGAKDLDGWEIPIEDRRFEFLISAAGSASVNFMATPGVGKIDLEWNNAGLQDLLGFNMFRFQHITDTTFTIPELINSNLILDTLFTDFNVTPGIQYYYYYKVLRTDFSESDSSVVISAVALTAAEGDANGDLAVNVLDITSIVSFILNQNPQPFVFEAADVNDDNQVNVLDIISLIQMISVKSWSEKIAAFHDIPPAYISMINDKIMLRSEAQVAAIQFELTGKNLMNNKVISLLPGFELAYSMSENKIIVVLYNFNGLTIPSGLQGLVELSSLDSNYNWGKIIAGDRTGNEVKIIVDNISVTQTEDFSFQIFPNPSNGVFTVVFDLPEKARIDLKLYSLIGREITILEDGLFEQGPNSIFWNGIDSRQPVSGIFICKINVEYLRSALPNSTRYLKLIISK